MNYREAREYLDRISASGTILGLENIRNLMAELGDPQDHLKIVHLAGTNGKGSILAYTASVLQAAGYRVGAYSSPSVRGYLERFQINGAWMQEEELAPLVQQVQDATKRLQAAGKACPTVFEMETAIAFLYFAEQHCDYVMLEVGMGGRLDSTNVIRAPQVCAFASISMDHMGMLGSTPEEIAAEKAGIIKPGALVVTGWQQPAAEQILEDRAKALACRVRRVDRASLVSKEHDLSGQTFDYGELKDLRIQLLGAHQPENAATAIETLWALREKGAEISEEALRRGLAEAKWPGRFEIIRREGRIFILDGAHNEDAAKRLAENLECFWPGIRMDSVMGVFKDKEYGKIVQLLAPHLKRVRTVDLPNRARTLPKELLAETLKNAGVEAGPADSVEEALLASLQDEEEQILVTGSLSYLGEARAWIMKEE